MSEKTQQKRQLILESARQVFAECGYRAVTMKDIVEKSGISRGGLYLYFSSVEELFLAVLAMEEERVDEEITDEALAGKSSADLLVWFFKSQEKEILNKKESLLTAKYEYAFLCSQDQEKTMVYKEELEKKILVLCKILQQGLLEGELLCEKPKSEARDMVYAIEGMKVLACTVGITKQQIDREFMHMVKRMSSRE